MFSAKTLKVCKPLSCSFKLKYEESSLEIVILALTVMVVVVILVMLMMLLINYDAPYANARDVVVMLVMMVMLLLMLLMMQLMLLMLLMMLLVLLMMPLMLASQPSSRLKNDGACVAGALPSTMLYQ